MRRTRVQTPLAVSIVLHLLALAILALYVLVEKEIITNPFAADIVAPAPPPKPRVRKPVARRRLIPKEIWSEVVYGEDEAGGVSLVDLNTTNPERMDTP
ncbi:hypothetical protein CMK11_07640, partial [Candidatus Poribacteria bacterium]|nr:hypothetical protein [Candidatus Poribacteria bacterium]